MTPQNGKSERGVREASQGDEDVLRLHAEDLSVSKEQIVTGRVRVSTVTHEREGIVDEQLSRERVEIERKPIGTHVSAIPEVRVEGDVTIFPVVEEVLFVERRLFLKEEVRIRRVRSTERFTDRVMLREQEAVVTHEPPDDITTNVEGE
jgi:uncharacterized protein (TIGR02271 family)